MTQLFFTHRITGETLRLKHLNGPVATCYIETPYTLFNNVTVDVAVCLVSNLIPITQ
jgi:hypothetical protein